MNCDKLWAVALVPSLDLSEFCICRLSYRCSTIRFLRSLTFFAHVLEMVVSCSVSIFTVLHWFPVDITTSALLSNGPFRFQKLMTTLAVDDGYQYIYFDFHLLNNVPNAHLWYSDCSLRMKTRPKVMTERESSDEDEEENLTEEERG